MTALPTGGAMVRKPNRVVRVLRSRQLRIALTVAALLALLGVVWQQRELVVQTVAATDKAAFVVAVLLALLANVLIALPFRLFLRQHGTEVSCLLASKLQLVSQVGKYIPGKVLSLMMQAQVIGLGSLPVLAFVAVETILFQMLTLATAGFALVLLFERPVAAIATLVLGIAATGMASRLALISRAGRAVGAALGRLPDGNRESVHPVGALAFAACSIAQAVVYFSFCVMLLSAVTELDHRDLVVCSASIMLSWVIGSVVFLVPAGIGVRELGFVALAEAFGTSLPTHTLVSIAVLMRVALLASDLIAAVLAAPTLFASQDGRARSGSDSTDAG